MSEEILNQIDRRLELMAMDADKSRNYLQQQVTRLQNDVIDLELKVRNLENDVRDLERGS